MPTAYTNESPNISGEGELNLSQNSNNAITDGMSRSKTSEDILISDSDKRTTQSLNLALAPDDTSTIAPLKGVASLDHFINKSFASSDDTLIVGFLALSKGLDHARMIARLTNLKYDDSILSLLDCN